VNTPIQGRLIVAGTMTVNGEEFTGLAFEVDLETLANLPQFPMYQQCAIAAVEPENPKRKVVQVATSQSDRGFTNLALCDDATIWEWWVEKRCWKMLPPIPQD